MALPRFCLPTDRVATHAAGENAKRFKLTFTRTPATTRYAFATDAESATDLFVTVARPDLAERRNEITIIALED